MKNFFKSKYLIVSGITLLIYIIILVINGVVPFGRNAGARIDYIQQMLPSFQWLWDVLHGNASLTYSPLFGGGGNMYGLQVIDAYATIFCPIFYLIGLFPRTAVNLGIVVTFAVMMLITVNIALFVFGRLFKNINKWYIMFFAVVWTISPWSFIHASPIVWHLVVALFPLLLLSIKHIETRGKITPFIAIFTYCLIISLYISYMILVALVAVGLAYILMCSHEKRKFAALLSFGLIFSLLLSMFAFYPGITYGLSAYRFGDGVVKEVLYENYGSKLFPLIWAPLPIVLVAFYFIKHFKEDKRNARFFAVALGILCCGLVFERINAMWHSGSYYSYPHRYSFITILTLILMSLYYMNKFDWRADFKSRGDRTTNIISLSVFTIVAVSFLYLYAFFGTHPAFPLSFGETMFAIATAVLAAFVFILTLRFPNVKVRNVLAAALSLGSILSFSLVNLAMPYNRGSISRADLLHTIDTVGFELPYRIKDKDNFFTFTIDAGSPNYGVTIRYPSLSVWQGAHPAAPTYAMRYLGFNEQGVWLSDSGGTIFSDMLMGNRYVISTDDNLNSAVYTKIDGTEYEDDGEKIYIYEYKYKLPFVNIVDADTDIEKIYSTDIKEVDIDLVIAQNELYRKFFGNAKPDIINKLDNITVEEVTEFENMRKITVPASALNNFYLHMNGPANPVSIPAYCLTEGAFANLDTKKYNELGYLYLSDIGKQFGHGLFDLDIHDTDFTFYIWAERAAYFDGLYVAELSLTELATVSTDANNYTKFQYTDTGVKLTISGQAGQKVFIPMTNLTGATATVNGRAVDVYLALNAYISIDLADGENNIEITFTPMNFKMGLLITLVTLFLLFALFLLNRFFNLSDKKWAQWVGVVIGCIIVAAVGYLVFLKPIALTIITDIFRIGA